MDGGPMPKPVSLRQRRNKPRSAALAKTQAIRVPLAPEYLTPKMQKEWVALWNSPLAQALVDTDLFEIERLFFLRDEWTRTLAALHAKPPPKPVMKKGENENEFWHRFGQWRLQLAATQRLVSSPKGGTMLNPLLKYLKELAAEITALSDRFGFNLITRQKLGLNDLHARTLAQQNNMLNQEDEDDDEYDPVAALQQSRADGGREASA